MLTEEQQEELRAQLNQDGAKLMRSLGISHEMIRNGNGELRIHSDHLAEKGTDAQAQTVNVSLAERLGENLERVIVAISRLDDSPETFDQCTDCGAAIPFGRLQYAPTTQRCCACKSMKEGLTRVAS